ncbi:biopolymer transporter ExbB [uncultured Litoreibacter sp.]|uniref:biopolymer transporter ExbB n=1 Tax=uncultured Litoreibacter sp. TaxID=1392394 RepID=UPI00261D355C|nr:biopolymer transporter ExbB [uncultured Litoreibacter sp.]
MDTPIERERTPQFTQPVRQIMVMLVILGLVAFGGYLIYPSVSSVFLANPYLNGVILSVFVAGVLACFVQVLQLISSVSWIESFAHDRADHDKTHAPTLLASLAGLLRSRGARMQISSGSSRTILDSVATRMDEARDITRYIINLLIFLGLLGTFYGLATTIPGVVDTIRSLNVEEGESGAKVFGDLMNGLESQLAGMGTAFASSLLGLAGSLVVGLLELFAGHGQNRFYREMEEWLSTITRVGFSSGEGDGGGGFDQGVVATVLDHMVEQIDSLQGLFVQGEASRVASAEKLDSLTRAVATLTNRLDMSIDPTDALNRVADGQERLLAKLAETTDNDIDPESRMRLRSIDVQMLKILEEMSSGRQESMGQLHTDLVQVTQAVRQLTRERRPSNTRRLPDHGKEE